MIRQIVVGFADVDTAREATRQAAELARQLGARLHVVTAVEDDDRSTIEVGTDRWELSRSEHAESVVNTFMTSLGFALEHTVASFEGSPGEVLISEAKRLDADLIVVGNVRMQGIGRVLGSVGNHVAHHAPCSVLIVKTV